MPVFQPVTFHFDGTDYKVEPNGVLKVISIIEEHVSLEDLCRGSRGYKRAAIANAYCAALNHLGCVTATPEKVYDSLFSDTTFERLGATINALVLLMVPPDRLKQLMDKLAKEAKKDGKKKLFQKG
jgi:hypothetical protein